ncbi:MAG: hypothetical protein JRN15_15335, partial [Nitrososphaerota archaeon]|nr:hypothetical protein [Nitrososphaerota archaeon]
LANSLRAAIAEIMSQILPPRRLRSNPRAVRKRMSGYPTKRKEHWLQPTRPLSNSIFIIHGSP